MVSTNKTRYAVLGILSIQSASGYDIKKMLEQSTNHFWREGDGSLYPILKQLEKELLITCVIENAQSGKPKKTYTLTIEGEKVLQAWLQQEAGVKQVRNELLLKVFFAANTTPDITSEHILNFRRQTQNKLTQFRELESQLLAQELSGARLYRYLTLQCGILHCETDLKWCDQSLGVLKNEF